MGWWRRCFGEGGRATRGRSSDGAATSTTDSRCRPAASASAQHLSRARTASRLHEPPASIVESRWQNEDVRHETTSSGATAATRTWYAICPWESGLHDRQLHWPMRPGSLHFFSSRDRCWTTVSGLPALLADPMPGRSVRSPTTHRASALCLRRCVRSLLTMGSPSACLGRAGGPDPWVPIAAAVATGRLRKEQAPGAARVLGDGRRQRPSSPSTAAEHLSLTAPSCKSGARRGMSASRTAAADCDRHLERLRSRTRGKA